VVIQVASREELDAALKRLRWIMAAESFEEFQTRGGGRYGAGNGAIAKLERHLDETPELTPS